ncbi:TPA: hypothetical protein ACXPT9_004405 [Bacillus cereus]|uniref:hypothetical protein n=1 Tax=Bacillus cereus group TaxID=86661 RepID=UPI00123C3186|nr:hypothetical protein [Bacillus cereus]KAA6457052.1 hypothetical protein DX930_30340 [Bacillus cereus]KAB2418884.1 hypothetical protein F8169_00175 [Bacillus cereus]KAB2439216.1 hypothetical protein F8166_00110 [Bacillus cereus]KAB2470262.1 hypothetical protein F8164_03835 [Bacillus cereus]
MKKDRYQRIEIINQIIKEIASRGRDFLNSKEHNRISYFVWDRRTLWFIDYGTGIPLAMRKGSSYPTKKQEYSFSGGGTLWALVNDFKDFIFGDDDANGNNGYGGLYCTHWGYPEEDMNAIQQLAKELDYLKGE